MKKSYNVTKKQRQRIVLEFIWILVALLITALVLLPIYSKTIQFNFWVANAAFVFTFVTIARVLFTFKYTFWARSQYFKLFLIFACLPLLAYLINGLNYFLAFLDDYSLAQFLSHLPDKSANEMTRYIRTEMIFFAVGAIIATFILPFRLVVSLWRQRNRGTV